MFITFFSQVKSVIIIFLPCLPLIIRKIAKAVPQLNDPSAACRKMIENVAYARNTKSGCMVVLHFTKFRYTCLDTVLDCAPTPFKT